MSQTLLQQLREMYLLAIHSDWVPSTSPAAHRREGHAVVLGGQSDSATSSNRKIANPFRQIRVEVMGWIAITMLECSSWVDLDYTVDAVLGCRACQGYSERRV